MTTQFERELEELLRNLGELGPKESRWQRLRRGLAQRWYGFLNALRDLPRTVPADQLMLAAILFIFSAYFLRFVLPNVARFVGLVGLALFFAAFVISFNQLMRGAGRDPLWRGRPVNMGAGGPTLMDRLVLWLRRRLRGY